MKHVEAKLYEAFQKNRGVRLTAQDVYNLLRSDVIEQRIIDLAYIEAGFCNFGRAWIPMTDRAPKTWSALVNSLKE